MKLDKSADLMLGFLALDSPQLRPDRWPPSRGGWEPVESRYESYR